MSFDEVKTKTTFTGFSDHPDLVATILAAMQTAYEGSATARAMFDGWLSDPAHTISVYYGRPSAYTGTGVFKFGQEYPAPVMYIDNNGTAVKATALKTIVHELVHALMGLKDDGAGARDFAGDPSDYRGATVSFSNIIYRELGIPEQNSYIGQDYFDLSEGTQYTYGAAIDRSVVISALYTDPEATDPERNWDSSPLGNSRDLLIGNASANKLEAGDGNDFLYGNGGNDTLDGGGGDDRLEGNADDDVLQGGTGRDELYGGTGQDTYIEGFDDAIDTISDIDGLGTIQFGGQLLTGGTARADDPNARPVSWYDGDLTYRRDGNYLYVIQNGQIELCIADFDFENGGLGISLKSAAPGSDAQMNYLTPLGYFHNVTLSPTARAVTTGSRVDEVWGSGQGDYIVLGEGSDYCSAAGGNDVIFGELGKDYINAGPFPGDFEDDDYATGGLDRDVIRGGGGKDILCGGEFGEHRLPETADSADFGDWVNGNEGDDELYGSLKSDILQGGAGSDLIHGGAGDDLILGDGNLWQTVRFSTLIGVSNIKNWADGDGDGRLTALPDGSISMPQMGTLTDWHVVYTDGREDFSVSLGSGQNWSGGEPQRCVAEAEAGGDILHGGEGNDWIAGQYGNDVLYGDDGDDVLYGDDVGAAYAGNDLLYAGMGADTLYGGEGNDLLYALEDDGAEDVLHGGEGQDVLYGATGHDRLFGEGGDDLLVAGADGGELHGGTGADRFHFQSDALRGAGSVCRIMDAAAEDRAWLDDVALASLTLLQVADNTWRSANDRLLFTLTGGSLTIQAIQGGAASAGRIVVERFSNGILGLTLPSAEPEAPPITGTDAADVLVGGADDDRLLGGAGNDTLRAGDGDDVLDGGDDIDSLYAGFGDDRLLGGAGNDRLYGERGDDTLRGGEGNDLLYDAAGDETYVFARGDGADTLFDGEGDDTLIFEGIDYTQLWFAQTGPSGRNLEISVLGAGDTITVTDWFLNPKRQIEHIEADGASLDASQVAGLVGALADYAGLAPPDDVLGQYWSV